MSDNLFIAEFHDIGKLVDWDAPGLKKIKPGRTRHIFEDFQFSQLGITEPSSPSWWTQFGAKVGSLNSTKVPKDYVSDVVLTNVADELAASISRTWGKKGAVVEGLHVLWNPSFYQKEVFAGKRWAAATTRTELKNLISFFDECNNPEELLRKYAENLVLRAEDRSAPLNITDLLTHLELTGKIYRVLKRHSRFDQHKSMLIYDGCEIQQANEATGGRIDKPDQKGKWVYRLIFCSIAFPQSLTRLQDLNIFRKRVDLIRAFSENENTKDYVLFSTDDSMCLFIPRENEVKIGGLLESFIAAGFSVDRKEMEAELNLLTSSFIKGDYEKPHSLANRYLKIYERRTDNVFPDEIHPPLCDSCQVRQGKERVKEQIREYLCDICYDIREIGEPAREYAEWDEVGLSACWMKITLDQDQLLRTIHRLFEEYVNNHSAMQTVSDSDKIDVKRAFRPLAVQVDFVKHYRLFLDAFNNRVYEIRDYEEKPFFTRESFLYPIDGYYELGVFKAYSGDAISKVLDLFNNLLEEYFPNCLERSPIKLSLSLAHVKYPYQEHWRFLNNPENTINIQSPGSAKLNIDIAHYKLLREKIRKEDANLSHLLHRLADVETKVKSSMALMLEILENRKRFPALLELVQGGLSIRQILEFYELTRGEIAYERR